MKGYPKIMTVRSIDHYKLLVTFDNRVTKIYDCTLLFAEAPFSLLRNKPIFQSVQVDKGGYGIFWNDELDLSEAELWINGESIKGFPNI